MTGTETQVDAALERVLAGDVEAYAELVRAHQAAVWRTVSFALRDYEASRDLVQQAFVNAYRGLDRFERGRPFGPWVRAIARNLVREELRRRAREDKRLVAYRDAMEVRLKQDPKAREREDALHAALAQCRQALGEPAQTALRMRYEQALGFDEIASDLNRTVAATRQLLQRLRLKLRTCIEGRLARA